MGKNKVINFILKVIFAFCIGISISLIITQRNAEFKKLVQAKLQRALKQIFAGEIDSNKSTGKDKIKDQVCKNAVKNIECDVDCKISSINLFIPKVELEYLSVKAKDGSFSWICKPIEISFSWLDFFLGGLIDIHIDISDIKVNSNFKIENKKFDLAFLPNIMSLISGQSSDVPAILKSLSIKKGNIKIFDFKEGNSSDLDFSGITKNVYGNYKTKIYFIDGSLNLNSNSIFNKLSGYVGFDIWQNSQGTNFVLDCKNTLNLKFGEKYKTCFVSGKWNDGKGLFDIASQDKSFSITQAKLYSENKSFFAQFNFDGDLKELKSLGVNNELEIDGNCSGKLNAEFGEFGFGVNGVLKLEKVSYKISEDYLLFLNGQVLIKNIGAEHFGNFSTNVAIKDAKNFVNTIDFTKDLTKDYTNKNPIKNPAGVTSGVNGVSSVDSGTFVGGILSKATSFIGSGFGPSSKISTANNYGNIIALDLSGNFNFDLNKKIFDLEFLNNSKIEVSMLKGWKILPGQIKLIVNNHNNLFNKNLSKNKLEINSLNSNLNKSSLDKDWSKIFDSLYGKFTCTVNNKNKKFNLSGDVEFLNSLLTITGKFEDKKYDLAFDLSRNISKNNLKNNNKESNNKNGLLSFGFKDNVGKQLFSVQAVGNEPDKFKGAIDFSFVKSISKDFFDYEIHGEGDLKFYGMKKDRKFLLDVNFKNATVSIPNIYNFLSNFKIMCIIDPENKVIVAKNSIINFHKGFVTSKKTVLKLEDDFSVSYVYAPFVFNNCFFNLKNDVFAILSGRMLFAKNKDEDANLQGLAIIERAHIKKNIFAESERRKYMRSSGSSAYKKNILTTCNCDLSVITKDPVRINTDFINTNAYIDLSIKNKIFDPQISGKIDFNSGTLEFPYKPLNITKGSIYFLQHQPFDPIIELTASNKINKYNVTMYVSGSVQNYNISFESCPVLNEEQIVALLIAGSAQESLSVVAPAILMQTIKDSLFGSGKTKFSKNGYLDKILKPFKKVRVVPSFSDQSGRGGLRATLEVDLNERARAMVEKNFNLSEDTRFELEYLLADDVALRGVRRENGDIGGEVEMRWKF